MLQFIVDSSQSRATAPASFKRKPLLQQPARRCSPLPCGSPSFSLPSSCIQPAAAPIPPTFAAMPSLIIPPAPPPNWTICAWPPSTTTSATRACCEGGCCRCRCCSTCTACCTQPCTCIRNSSSFLAQAHVHTLILSCAHTHPFTNTRIYIHSHIHTYAHARTHTHIHAHPHHSPACHRRTRVSLATKWFRLLAATTCALVVATQPQRTAFTPLHTQHCTPHVCFRCDSRWKQAQLLLQGDYDPPPPLSPTSDVNLSTTCALVVATQPQRTAFTPLHTQHFTPHVCFRCDSRWKQAQLLLQGDYDPPPPLSPTSDVNLSMCVMIFIHSSQHFLRVRLTNDRSIGAREVRMHGGPNATVPEKCA